MNKKSPIDFIFFCIKKNKGKSVKELYDLYSTEFDNLNIDKDDMDEAVKFLINDKKIYSNTHDGLRVLPQANNFAGYSIPVVRESIEESGKQTFDKFIKISPLILTILTVFHSIFFSYLNYQLNASNAESKTEVKKIILRLNSIDSLLEICSLKKKTCVFDRTAPFSKQSIDKTKKTAQPEKLIKK